MSSSDEYRDSAGDDGGGDEVIDYVRDDVAREYRRAFPDEQMSM